MDIVDLTRRLVAIDSQNPGASEGAIVDEITVFCRAQGFNVRRVEVEPGRPNLLVTVDRGPGPHLGFSGHLDTKPVGDALGEWRTDPFEVTVDSNVAYGLGTSDMKGAVAAMLLALQRFAAEGPSGVLALVLTADEEQGSNAGAKALASSELPPLDALVIGEPSGIERPWEALHLVSRGITCFEVDVRTAQGHSGLSARLGRNAVLVAADIVKAFEQFHPPVDEPGLVPCSPTVNPGMLIEGGVCFGTWPGRCTVGVEIRLVPGMHRDSVRSTIRRLVDEIVGETASATIRYHDGSLGWMPAVGLDPDTAIVTAAQRAAQRVLGCALPIAAYPGGTDATYFMNTAGIPTIASLGPGWLSVAHGPNEHVGVDQLHQAVELYAVLAEEFLAPPGDPRDGATDP
jgi:acetylornithine deacetylase/succinyl-diaminopimelate desuccinylase-like protein